MATNPALPRLALGALATASTASGAIVVFDINPNLSYAINSAGGTGFAVNSISLQNGTYVRGSDVYNPFLFSVATRNGYLDFNPRYQSAQGLYGTNQNLRVLGFNETIGSAGTFSPYLVFAYNSQPGRESLLAAGGTSYLGMRLAAGAGSYNYGWIELTYGPLGAGNDRDITLTRFAVESIVNQSITTPGAVPEASTLGLVGGLFGLVAAAHVRRRKAKQAAASDKFLALAAGEKLN